MLLVMLLLLLLLLLVLSTNEYISIVDVDVDPSIPQEHLPSGQKDPLIRVVASMIVMVTVGVSSARIIM